MTEQVPAFEGYLWMGIVAPAATPDTVVARLATAIQRFVEDNRADLLVMATRAGSEGALRHGSVAETVARRAGIPGVGGRRRRRLRPPA